ncbi:MAG: chorismate synthase [Acutalibacteraceae bacterium]|nr:chorismate synthase [Acutalibacteraceae bacterium]
MKNTIGQNVSVTLFGESHGEGIGAVIDGLAAGIEVDESFIENQLDLRRPVGKISTPRVEKDNFKILSGVFEGKTTGTPICIVIPNDNTKSKDYGEIRFKMRPSHADFTANEKYHGFEEYRGGGHFSGRITAGLVAAGAIAINALKKKGIIIGSHISRLGGIADRDFENFNEDINALNQMQFAVLDGKKAEEMQDRIMKVRAEGDSVGGVIETAVVGLPAGVGEPWFDTVESMISHAIFAIPAVKGIEFGAGFSIAEMKGSEANDPFRAVEGKIVTETNRNGGINGGITNGMPVIFRTAIKPTPTISKEQNTVDIRDNSNTTLMAHGRHDPCIVHRARVVVDSVTAIVLLDLLSSRFGTDWMA